MPQKKWRKFSKAREYVRSLGLLGSVDWYAYARGELKRFAGLRPPDIPFCPARDYRGDGWRGMRDWLGPPPVEPVEPGYLEFRKARTFARSLGLRSDRGWRSWCDGKARGLPPRPRNIPVDPKAMYPRVFRGWHDWLGVARANPPSRAANLMARQYRDFADARAFARGLGLRSHLEWRDFCRGKKPELGTLPDDIPSQPENAFTSFGWKGYGDWLGTGTQGSLHHPALTFAEAREIAQGLGLKSGDEYREWARGGLPDLPPRPDLMPTNPQRTYADSGWVSWGDFLATGNIFRGDYRPFDQARSFAQSLGIQSALEWRDYAAGRRPDIGTRPADIPSSPEVTYPPEEWTNWGDFLGTGRIHEKDFRSFRAARRFVRGLRLKNNAEWRAFSRGDLSEDFGPRPDDIPSAPDKVYADTGWKGWGDFLGNGEPPKVQVGRYREPAMPFEEARAFVRSLDLKSIEEWRRWLGGNRPDLPEIPDHLPRSPITVYAEDGWLGFVDFLGIGNGVRLRGKARDFEEARKFARTLGLRSGSEWQAWSAGRRPDLPPRPHDIPAKPFVRYEEFISWADFLGADHDARGRKPDAGRG
jgi:hypothetical protein